MVISTNQKPTIYRNLYENTSPATLIYYRVAFAYNIVERTVPLQQKYYFPIPWMHRLTSADMCAIFSDVTFWGHVTTDTTIHVCHVIPTNDLIIILLRAEAVDQLLEMAISTNEMNKLQKCIAYNQWKKIHRPIKL